MHEMSIAAGILDIVEQQVRANGAGKVEEIEVEVGTLAGIEVDSLRFCFEIARRDTLAHGAELVIHEIPGRGRCVECGQTVEVDFFVAVCPECSEGLVEIQQGKELRVRSIRVESPNPAPQGGQHV